MRCDNRPFKLPFPTESPVAKLPPMSLPVELQSAAAAAKETLDASVLAFIKKTFEDAVAELAKSIGEPVRVSFPRKRAWMSTLRAMFDAADVAAGEGHLPTCPQNKDSDYACECTQPGYITYVVYRRGG